LKGRLERIDEIVANIIAACLGSVERDKEGKDYYKKNEEFAHELVNVINSLKHVPLSSIYFGMLVIDYFHSTK